MRPYDGQDADAQCEIAECDAKLREHRAALEAGADAVLVTGWMKETQAKRAAAQARLTKRVGRRRMTRDEITSLVQAIGDVIRRSKTLAQQTKPRSTAGKYSEITWRGRAARGVGCGLYQRCAAVDMGKDVIAVAVRLPGDGPDGRQTVKRTFKTFYGVLREAARWLTSLGVTHVAMEAGSTACRPATR